MPITKDEVQAWTRDFCAALKVEKSLLRCFQIAEQKQSNEELLRVLVEVREIVGRGYPISTIMALFPHVFDADYVTIVSYGEIYGEVDLVLERYLEHPQGIFRPCGVASH